MDSPIRVLLAKVGLDFKARRAIDDRAVFREVRRQMEDAR